MKTTKSMQADPYAAAVRWFAAISILPAVALPLYNLFLHGPRDAVSIISRGSAYYEAHLVGGVASLLLISGLLALYLYHARRLGRFGRIAFTIALVAQAAWAAILFVDGIFNPLLAHFDPHLQTHLHSAEFSQTASHDYLQTLFGGALHIFNALSLVYMVGFVLFGIALFRAKIMPRPIGVLLAIGSVPLAFALMLPQWLETMGYAAIACAIVWAAVWMLRNPVKPETGVSLNQR